jgi:hypothetical protein
MAGDQPALLVRGEAQEKIALMRRAHRTQTSTLFYLGLRLEPQPPSLLTSLETYTGIGKQIGTTGEGESHGAYNPW